jgi:hypothetical protein
MKRRSIIRRWELFWGLTEDLIYNIFYQRPVKYISWLSSRLGIQPTLKEFLIQLTRTDTFLIDSTGIIAFFSKINKPQMH